MNQFEYLADELKRLAAGIPGVELEISKPASPDGVWMATLHARDGYWVEAEWKQHRGFGVSAGYDASWNEPPHESYGSWEHTARRMLALWNAKEVTSRNLPVPVAELRKLRGHLQKDVAEQMGITKGGLAQIEASANEGKVQVDTLGKLVAAMGGRLVISATFPDGTERKVAVGR